MRTPSPTTAPSRGLLAPVRRAVRRMRDRLRGGSLVLLYHRVATVPTDPWGLCVAPARFAAQMEVLAARRLAAPLEALVAPDGGRAWRRVAVTFDDGYEDFRTAALPVLERHEIPATLFVTSAGLAGTREFWWDALTACVLEPAALPAELAVDVGGARRVFDTAAHDRDALHRELHALLGHAPGWAREAALRALREAVGLPAAVRPSHRPLSVEDLRAVMTSRCVTVGAHTVSHPYLTALPPDEQEREVRECRRFLRALTGAPIADFSHPHGDHDAASIERVRAAGYRSACGTAAALAHVRSDRWALPRVEAPDLDGEDFARWLDGWMGGV